MCDQRKVEPDDIIEWIREYFRKNGPDCSAVIGMSGGKDSLIVAALCMKALGTDRVVGVEMPCGKQEDIAYADEAIELLGIRKMVVNIEDTVHALVSSLPLDASQQAGISMRPRVRMMTLYAIAQSLPEGGRVANTCNLSEDTVGWFTRYGDGAGDFSPLGSLTVTEVRQLGLAMGLPKHLVMKIPSDGLCGKTDEEGLGVSYEAIDRYIRNGTSGHILEDNIIRKLVWANDFKLKPVPAF